VERRIARLDPRTVTTAREGSDTARTLRSAGGMAPVPSRPLERVQVDHTAIDLILADEHDRSPIGRPGALLVAGSLLRVFGPRGARSP
jgi:putative transposase